ncbi:uncharacterized protein PHALS_11450 [Plasmopara halstedii]|uniref:Uncharacterized protein n=1 Tax=Plasmopara halstedii TaxID=4781 RepID=A0A0N7L3D6_PLAHL|nr:uncharacterized protein PHALS_11450 [Plasmopara halstedii]CEG35579.1 hypothetical protein PHALS_11450 [Plasmopara halstedii]|eukprot:XP_024571948.1 hypothetical protein PHALS_11450 [Plasmopara halstedii]
MGGQIVLLQRVKMSHFGTVPSSRYFMSFQSACFFWKSRPHSLCSVVLERLYARRLTLLIFPKALSKFCAEGNPYPATKLSLLYNRTRTISA